jgi:hypothetical protein
VRKSYLAAMSHPRTQQILNMDNQVMRGEYDYSKLRGQTGPLVRKHAVRVSRIAGPAVLRHGMCMPYVAPIRTHEQRARDRAHTKVIAKVKFSEEQVYPGGFVWVFAGFRELTNDGKVRDERLMMCANA